MITHPMTDLAESILRKIVDDDGGYVALYRDSVCVDVWVWKLTPTEVDYLVSLGVRSDEGDD